MNLGQLKTRFRVSIGNPTTADVPDTGTSSSPVGTIDYLNDAYDELADRYNHYVLKPRARFNTIAGTGKYELPGTIGAILHVWDRTNKQPLSRTSMDFVKRQEFANPQPPSAKPEKYLHVDDFLQLLPIPDGVYEIEFQHRLIVTPLVLDTDVPILPTTWHRGIYLLARWNYWTDQGDVPKALAAKEMYDAWVEGKPLESDEAKMSDDTGVSLPTLGDAGDRRLDFEHSE